MYNPKPGGMSLARLRWAFLAVSILMEVAAPLAAAAANTISQPCQVRDLRAGNDATCMVMDTQVVAATTGATVPVGGAMCFGYWPQLGANVGSPNRPVPLPVFGLSSPNVTVATMQPGVRETSCGVFVGPSGWRQLRCTGKNNAGQLGCGFTGGNVATNYQTIPCDAVGLPTPAGSDTQVKGSAMGEEHTVVWLDNGKVFAAGAAPMNGQDASTTTFTEVPGLANVTSCTAGEGHTCCLVNTGKVYCWGRNPFGQIGFPNGPAFTKDPILVQQVNDVVQLAAGGASTAALLSTGTVVSWGYNGAGQLGDGSTLNSDLPKAVGGGLDNVKQISAGLDSMCALLTNGTVRCWGNNAYGQAGAGVTCSDQKCTTPQAPVPSVSDVASVVVGAVHVCVTYLNKTASCWGSSRNGQLSASTNAQASPGRVVMCEVRAPGCPAPPPSGGTITAYQSCSTPLVEGEYVVDTVCTATCAAGATGGFAKCGISASGAPVWQVTACTPGCSSASLPVVPNAVWSGCGASVIAGASCSGSCAAGFDGGLTAVCVGPSWSTTGSCTRVGCLGPPPSGAPNATFQCASSTPVGQPCNAVCAAGLSGSPRRVCLADGTWSTLEGDACVDCVANQPKLTANQLSTSVPAGSSALSAQFTLKAPFIKGTTTLLAKLDGVTACTTQPAELTGAVATPTVVTVSCQVATATGISAGPHKLALTAATTGSNGCSGDSTTSLVDILATSAPTPAPSVLLAATAGAAPSACKAAAGQPSTVSASFAYEVAPAASSFGGLVLEIDVAATAAGAACTTARSGGLERGTLEVTCRGIFDSLTSLGISVTLKAWTAASIKGSATSSQTVAFICCTAATTLARAINASAGSHCQTCGGNASAIDGVWLRGGLQAGVMRAGAISSSTCSSASAADFGSITTMCDEQNSKLLHVTITNPAGSAATKIEFLARCNIDSVTTYMPSCTAPGNYRWRPVTPTHNLLTVTTSPSGQQTLSFSILQTSTQATCKCGTSFFAIKQTGVFSSVRPVSSSGSCTAAAGIRGKTGKARTVDGRLGHRLF